LNKGNWNGQQLLPAQWVEESTAEQAYIGPDDYVGGLDNRYRLTEMPASRPVGLRGRWVEPDEFELEYIILGDFIESTARVEFDVDQITLTVKNLNFSAPALVLHGNTAR
jgi:hypothetical protein